LIFFSFFLIDDFYYIAMHFEYIADAVSKGLMDVQLKMGVPTIFGVLTCLNEMQARARAGLEAGGHNHGIDWGLAAVQMINFQYSDRRCHDIEDVDSRMVKCAIQFVLFAELPWLIRWSS
jgi:hypothetical protein